MTAVTGDPPEFDLCGPLPVGTTVLEASAGTGKTYTIAALAARYLAEGVELNQLLLVTFGRMATNELRQRVRERLVTTEQQLNEVGAGRAPAAPLDAIGALLTTGDPTTLELRRTRLSRALSDFDAAPIATTHEFCGQMLDGLGVLGDADPEAVLVERQSELTREVATDLYLARYAEAGDPPLTYAQAQQVAADAVDAPHTRLVPEPTILDRDAGPAADLPDSTERVAYAAAVRAEVERRRRSGRVRTYDDLLTRLRDALADPVRGAAAASRLQHRFRVVMVDEFQDTDPVQWEILRRAFHGVTTLILIGDPKQAIYAFRGADVYSYLEAVGAARVQTLGTNRRSDGDLIQALDSLIGGAALGEDAIVVRPVRASHPRRRLRSARDPEQATPLRLRVLPHEPDAESVPSVGSLRPRVLHDLVAQISGALASDLELDLGSGPRRLRPADLAVLVRKNERGEAVQDALVRAGVPAVLFGAGSVFASPMATEWLTLLTALEQPRQAAIRQASLTCFGGWTFARLVTADEQALVELAQRFRWWSRVLSNRGVAALLEAVTVDTGLTERVLSETGGERRLTDLRHLGQSLHAAMTSGQLGVGALAEWLRQQIADARTNRAPEGTRRLETDAAAVSVLTVHGSKGLEFPVVYLPEAWDRHVNGVDEGRTLRLHEPWAGDGGLTAAGRCVLDVGGRLGPDRSRRFARHQAEESGEDLRLLYVALTRAQCQVVAWWAPSVNTPPSALQRFLYRPAPTAADGGEVAPAYALHGDPRTARNLGPQVSVETVPHAPAGGLPDATSIDGRRADAAPVPGSQPPLRVRLFVRELDLTWRRTSYSALTATVHGLPTPPAVGSEPELNKEDDEAVGGDPASAATDLEADDEVVPEEWGRLSPMADLPSGTAFGTAVHAVFEQVDPQHPDLARGLREACVAVPQLVGGPLSADALAAALLPVYATPLGPLVEDRALRDIPGADVLAELAFELPLAGGDSAAGSRVALGVVADLLRRHLPTTDPLAAYAERLDVPALAEQPLRGYLTGSIDAVLRVPGTDGESRYLVVDYKTNWLGGFDGQPLTLADYAPARLAQAMMAAHYPLQALLYGVAVHRMLRWRQPGYDPARHLGGVLYLFVRGMAGPDTPRADGVPSGVFSWRPPAQLTVELSDALAGLGEAAS